MFIHAGGAEGGFFFDQIEDLAQEMHRMEGHRVRLHVMDRAPQNLLAAAKELELERELEVAAEDACSFLGKIEESSVLAVIWFN
jgi:hypothetical protein